MFSSVLDTYPLADLSEIGWAEPTDLACIASGMLSNLLNNCVVFFFFLDVGSV